MTWVIGLSALVLAGLLSLRLKKIRRSISVAVYTFLISLIVGAIYLSSYNCARCITPEGFIKMSLMNSIAMAERSYLGSGYSYKSLCEDQLLIDIESNIKSQMLINSRRCYGPILNYLLPKKSVDKLFVCNASNESYAIEAYLHEKEKYVCVDIGNKVVHQDKSIGNTTSCSVPSESERN